jgi:hypothetical protein
VDAGSLLVLAVAVVLLLVWLVFGLMSARPGKPAPTLHRPARRGNVALLSERIEQGADLNAADRDGNTPLHLAHYERQVHAIRYLVENGADEGVPNRYGLVPEQMRQLADVEGLLRQGADVLTGAGSPTQPTGRAVRDKLVATPIELYLIALRRLAATDPAKNRIIFLAIMLGLPGTEETLCELLGQLNQVSIAVVYLNSGSPTLREAATRWAAAHHYEITESTGYHYVTWGAYR